MRQKLQRQRFAECDNVRGIITQTNKISADSSEKHKIESLQNYIHFEFFKKYWTGPIGFSPMFVWRIRAVHSSCVKI